MATIDASKSKRSTVAARPSKIDGPVVALPVAEDDLSQDEEWIVVDVDGDWKKIRLHDYGDVYAVPGLYEKWVYEILGCQSPEVIRDLLRDALQSANIQPSTLSVLDLGAGNGIVADELRSIGVRQFVGLDIEPEARVAADRDRPGLYDDFIVGDMLALSDDQRARLAERRLNCLTCVAALGFGDIPTDVFAACFNLIEDNGFIAFTIKEDFLDDSDTSGFSTLIRWMIKNKTLSVLARKRYVHRLSTTNEPLYYEAFIGRKRSNVSELPG